MTTKRANGEKARLRRLLGGLVLLAVPVAFIWWPGCRQYPAVTSVESLKLMKRLYAATNTRNPDWLAQVEKGVAQTAGAGKLTPVEQQAFEKIIALARAGDWQAAEQASFRFAQDQVSQGFPAARDHDDHDAHQHPSKGP